MERYEILPNILRYQSIFSDEIHMGILLPRQVHSLRSLMSTRPGLNEGMPQELIAEALRQVMACLRLIHKCLDYHRQISAGSIFYSPQLQQFQLAFAISVYDCYQPGDENVPRCPINTLLDWAKAPEEDQTWSWPSSQFKFPTPLGSRAGSDIWMVGVTALELAYGKIEVADRNQLLSIAAYICKKRKLPNTWQELRAKAESAAGGASSAAAGGASSSAAAGGASSSAAAASSSASDYPMTKPNSKINSIKKHVAESFSDNKRFSKSFARFVARCLNDDLTRRYTAEELLKYGFLTKYRISPEKMVALLGDGGTS